MGSKNKLFSNSRKKKKTQQKKNVNDNKIIEEEQEEEEEEQEEEEENDEGYWSEESNMSNNSSFSDADSETTKYYRNGFELLSESSVVSERQFMEGMQVKTGFFYINPYSMSATIFTISVTLSNKILNDKSLDKEERQQWTPRRLYIFFKDFFVDQVKIWDFCIKGKLPPFVYETAQMLLAFFTGKLDPSSTNGKNQKNEISYDEISSILIFFQSIHQLLKIQIKKLGSSIFRIPRGKFQRFKRIDEKELNNIIKNEFHYYHGQTNNNLFEPSCFHVDKKHLNGTTTTTSEIMSKKTYKSKTEKLTIKNHLKNENRFHLKQDVICFSREIVNPIQLHCSLQIIESRFKDIFKNRFWKVNFSEDKTLLFLDKDCLFTIIRYIIPYIAGNKYLICRQLYFPMHVIQLHNFFNGDPMALVYSMKFMLRCFTVTKNIGNNPLPKGEKDPVIDVYRILPEILDRFRSIETIWKFLIQTLRDDQILWFSSKTNNHKKKTSFTGGKNSSSSSSTTKEDKNLLKSVLRISNISNNSPEWKTMLYSMKNNKNNVEGSNDVSNNIDESTFNQNEKYLCGIYDKKPSFYLALRSFIYIYISHKIWTKTLLKIVDYFDNHEELKKKYSFAWILLTVLYCSSNRETDWTEIPEQWKDVTKLLFNNSGISNNISDKQLNMDFPFPSHIILYYLCTIPEFTDDIAIELFMSMNINPKRWLPEQGSTSYLRFSKSNSDNNNNNANAQQEKQIYHIDKFSKYYTKLNNIDEKKVNEEKNEEQRCSRSIDFLFQALEKLSQYQATGITFNQFKAAREKTEQSNYRGYVIENPERIIPLSDSEILKDSKIIPKQIIDIKDGEPLYTDEVLPIWKAGIHDISIEDSLQPKVLPGHIEASPFAGCHKDMLECLLLLPIETIQSLSYNKENQNKRPAETDREENPKYRKIRHRKIREEIMLQTETQNFNKSCSTEIFPFDQREIPSPTLSKFVSNKINTRIIVQATEGYEKTQLAAQDRESWNLDHLPTIYDVFRVGFTHLPTNKDFVI